MINSIYLAGGMSDMPFEEQNKWRRDFIKEIQDYIPYKCEICNPVDYYNFQNPRHETEKEILRFDLNKVRNSNLVIVNLNNPNSLGTMAEMAIAYDRRIPIIGINEQGVYIHPWITEMTDRIFLSLKNTIRYVEDFYLS